MNRLRAGFCKMVNPYNGKGIRISLKIENVDGIIFWTKNVGPFLKYLSEVKHRGFPFLLQYTINGYPRTLEQAVVDAPKAVDYLKKVADEFGPRVCIWRYDTIVNTSLTPREFHINNFTRLAKALEGATDEVVISFAYFYQKTLRNMKIISTISGFTWSDPDDEWKRCLAAELAQVAAAYQIRLSICSQPKFLALGCAEARCVDAVRLSDVAGRLIKARLKGNRNNCGCYESRDIGEYDTCPHGCIYCYAVQNRELAKSRYRQHDPTSESLFPIPRNGKEPSIYSKQLDLLNDTNEKNDLFVIK